MPDTHLPRFTTGQPTSADQIAYRLLGPHIAWFPGDPRPVVLARSADRITVRPTAGGLVVSQQDDQELTL
jgi:hypothetical protein